MHSIAINLLALALGLCLALESETSKAETLVYLLGGQSNMYGVALTADLTPPLSNPQPSVRCWNNGWVDLRPGLLNPLYFGPEVSFGRAMAEAKPDDDIYLIKYAAGGTNLAQQWAPTTGPQYVAFKNTVDAALASLDQANVDYRIAGMLWMQGESDALNAGFANAYENNLTNFIAQMRSDVRVPQMPFVMGRVLTYFDTNPPGGAATVRAAQQAVGANDNNVYWFNTDDLGVGSPDPGHYNAAGQIGMGNRFADILDDLAIPPAPAHEFDLNLDGLFDIADWVDVVQANMSRDLSGLNLTVAESRFYGDLDGNLSVDLADFRQFKEAYEAEYGSGALVAVLSVPEPKTIVLVVLGTSLVLVKFK